MDLNAPLGMKPPRGPRVRYGLFAIVGVALVAAVGFGAFLLTADPHGGEPTATATIPPLVPKTASVLAPIATDTTPTGTLSKPNGIGLSDAPTLEQGVKVYRGSETAALEPHASATPMIIDVSKALDEADRKSKPSSGLGTTPNQDKAQDDKTQDKAKPRVAIFVSGMGLSDGATRTAIETMPSGVTLAFLPYGDTISALVAAAKAKGHEVLLQLPMQSGRGTGEGPHTIRPDEPQAKIDGDLAWLMGRFEGYDGVANFLGAPVTGDTQTMTTILKAIGARNLFFLDDGTSKTSAALSIAPSVGVAAARADVILDATADPAVVKANLDMLVSIAKRKGSAIGMASGLPEHLGTIARFAAALGDQDVALVPVNALVGRNGSIATAQ